MILYIFLIFFFQKQKSLNQNMNDDEKVNLLKQSMSILIEQNENALVWYLQKIQFFYCNFCFRKKAMMVVDPLSFGV